MATEPIDYRYIHHIYLCPFSPCSEDDCELVWHCANIFRTPHDKYGVPIKDHPPRMQLAMQEFSDSGPPAGWYLERHERLMADFNPHTSNAIVPCAMPHFMCVDPSCGQPCPLGTVRCTFCHYVYRYKSRTYTMPQDMFVVDGRKFLSDQINYYRLINKDWNGVKSSGFYQYCASVRPGEYLKERHYELWDANNWLINLKLNTRERKAVRSEDQFHGPSPAVIAMNAHHTRSWDNDEKAWYRLKASAYGKTRESNAKFETVPWIAYAKNDVPPPYDESIIAAAEAYHDKVVKWLQEEGWDTPDYRCDFLYLSRRALLHFCDDEWSVAFEKDPPSEVTDSTPNPWPFQPEMLI